MLSAMKSMRPSCEHILRQKSFWALDMSEIENKSISEKFSKLSVNAKTIDESFYEYFIRTKLMYK